MRARALRLIESAVRLWHKDHKAPSARDRQRLSERVVAELRAGGDEAVIVHELSRDLHPSHTGSAVAVVMGARTRTPGWGRAEDPRPDHARYEVRPGAPWCGECDDRTRMVRVYDPSTGRTSPARCRQPVVDSAGRRVACHPEETLPPMEDGHAQGADLEEMTPEAVEAAMRASLAQASERPEPPQPRQSPGAAAEALRIAREAQQRSQATKATKAAMEQIRDAALREEAARLSRR